MHGAGGWILIQRRNPCRADASVGLQPRGLALGQDLTNKRRARGGGPGSTQRQVATTTTVGPHLFSRA
eukprot:993936-Alexandrium_andersonii.AAC.1